MIAGETLVDMRIDALDRAIKLHTDGHVAGDLLATAEQLYFFIAAPLLVSDLLDALADEEDEDEDEAQPRGEAH